MTESIICTEAIFVGRDRELEELLEYLASVIEGKSRFLIVSGETGIGKSRLINNFLNSLSGELPVTVLTGQCTRNPLLPYQPFIEAFGGCKGEGTNDSINWLKKAMQGQSSGLSSLALKDETFGSVKAILASMCTKKSVILFLEDIQWADTGSLELLAYLTDSIPARNLFVILTMENEDNIKSQEKIFESLNTIRKSKNFKEIKIAGLSSNEVTSLVHKKLGYSSQFLVEELLEKSKGNPLHILASLKILCIKQSEEKEQLNSEIVNYQKGLDEIIISLANRLPSEQRKVLDLASSLVADFDPSLLAKIMGLSTLEVLETLNAISENSCLINSDGAKYRFYHAKFQEVLYKELSEKQKLEYHDKIALTLEKDASPKQWELAYHFSRSSNLEKAIKYSLDSGELALLLMLSKEAAQYFNYVIAQTKDNPQYLIQKEKASESLGDTLLISGVLQSASLFEQLNEQTNSNGTKIRATRKAAHAYLLEGNHKRAFNLIRNPLNFSEIDPIENAHFSLIKGTIESQSGNISESVLDLEKALHIFEENQSNPHVIDALIELSIAYMGKDKDNVNFSQLEKSLACITRALALSEEIKDKNKQAYALQVAFLIFFESGLKKQALEVQDRLSRLSLTMNYPQSRRLSGAWSFWMSSFLVENNTMDKIFTKIFDKIEFCPQPKIEVTNDSKQEFRLAIEQCQKGVEIVNDKNLFEIQSLLYGNLVREHCFIGDLKLSEEFLNRLEAINCSISPRFVLTKSLYLFSKALSYSFKKQWQETNRFYKESIDYYSKLRLGTSIEAEIRQWYGCALLQQGRFEEGMQQIAQSKSTLRELEKKFTDVNIFVSQYVPSMIEAETDFTIVINITNIGLKPAFLTQAKMLIPSSFRIISTTPILKIKDSNAELENKQLDAFKNENLSFTLKTSTPGKYTFDPEINYLTDTGQSKSFILEPITFTVKAPAMPTTPLVKQTQASPSLTPQPSVQSPIQQISQPTPQQAAQPQIKTLSTNTSHTTQNSKPFDVFLCYKKSSAKDFADHLKAGLEELGLHTFLDSKDIPLSVTDNQVGWSRVRDNALNESKFFILIMTPGFNLSSEVVKEIDMARKLTDKTFIFFRHRNMGRRIVVNFANDSLDIGKLEQVSFESKEELLRLAVNILPCSKPS